MITRQAVIEAVSHALELPGDFPIGPDTRIDDVPGWDSLGWVSVVAALEEMTGRDFPLDRIDKIDTLDALFAAVEPTAEQPAV